jgi:hypothetical protein
MAGAGAPALPGVNASPSPPRSPTRSPFKLGFGSGRGGGGGGGFDEAAGNHAADSDSAGDSSGLIGEAAPPLPPEPVGLLTCTLCPGTMFAASESIDPHLQTVAHISRVAHIQSKGAALRPFLQCNLCHVSSCCTLHTARHTYRAIPLHR